MNKIEDMITLLPASEVRQVSDQSMIRIEREQIAYAINSCANTGEYSVWISDSLSETVQSELKANGYTLKQTVKLSTKGWLISW